MTTTLINIALDDLVADHPRADVEPLARSIQIDGLIEPLVVMQEGDRFKILNGNRRYWAIKLLYDKDDPVFDREHWRYSLGRTLYRRVPCEVIE